MTPRELPPLDGEGGYSVSGQREVERRESESSHNFFVMALGPARSLLSKQALILRIFLLILRVGAAEEIPENGKSVI